MKFKQCSYLWKNSIQKKTRVTANEGFTYLRLLCLVDLGAIYLLGEHHVHRRECDQPSG
jgi:hypothetical protein